MAAGGGRDQRGLLSQQIASQFGWRVNQSVSARARLSHVLARFEVLFGDYQRRSTIDGATFIIRWPPRMRQRISHRIGERLAEPNWSDAASVADTQRHLAVSGCRRPSILGPERRQCYTPHASSGPVLLEPIDFVPALQAAIQVGEIPCLSALC
jgi:hypothetical protein